MTEGLGYDVFEGAPPYGDEKRTDGMPPHFDDAPYLYPDDGRTREDIPPEALEECAKLDESDTDNAVRLIKYFGRDIIVRAEGEVEGGSWLVWNGTHWDLGSGPAGVCMLTQQVGALIIREAKFIAPTEPEGKLLYAAKKAQEEVKEKGTSISKEREEKIAELLEKAEKVEKGLEKRRARRKQFGLSSKNKNRIQAMMHLAAPRMRRSPDQFNADALLIATKTHTLRVIKAEDVPARVETILGHRRGDLCTMAVPVAYDPAALAPKWCAFLERFQPDTDSRRTLRMFTGLGLTGIATQWFAFHYGDGSNGKSVFMETICRVLGDLSVGLPIESIMETGAMKAGGQASPDIARLHGKRLVRVTEIPPKGELSTDAVKRLTSGEGIPVRTLFKGFFDFRPVAKPHFSTNGEPRVSDPSDGIWRRMLRIKWPVQIPEHERRDFDEVVNEFVQEAPGILNWMIDGVLDYLNTGRLFVSSEIRRNTESYREDQDHIRVFIKDCLSIVTKDGKPDVAKKIAAAEMYGFYTEWCRDFGREPISLTSFGSKLSKVLPRDNLRKRSYLGVVENQKYKEEEYGR